MKLLLLLLNIIISLAEAHKIFVYSPKYSASHVNFMGKLADILVRAGHNVTVYAPIIDESVATNGTKLAKVVLRERDFFSINPGDMQTQIWTGKIEGISNMQEMLKVIRISFGNLCKNQLDDDKLMEYFKTENFELALGEPFDLCYYGLLKRIGIKNYITVSSSGVFEQTSNAFGIPQTPSFVPSIISSVNSPMSYFERVENLIQTTILVTKMNQMFSGNSIEVMKKKFGANFDINEEVAKSALYFANVDEHVDFPRPISHKFIYIGGIGKVQASPLEKKFEDVMQQSKKGVILVSFGTVALSHNMPPEVKQVLLETFKKFPDVTFIWKYENDEHKIAEEYENVVTDKWVPQNDLLEHPKLLGFVSHGGMNSVQEGASKGVPMVMIPLFADQHRNSKMLEYRKMAVVLNRKQLTVETLTESLKKIIDDDTYRKNAKRISALISAKPMTAEERVVKYTEFAAKFGPDLNLDMEVRHLNFLQFYCLDIIIPAILLVAVVLYFVYRVVRFILGKVLLVVFSENRLKCE